jgi:arsenite/tail-anchored protein-transporting ATPase
LTDHSKTSVRVVLTLEQVVIAEAQRSFTYFHLYGYPTDLVVANRVLPDDQDWHYFRGWYEAQQRYGPLVENTFHPIPVIKAPFFDQEMVGVDLLRMLAARLYDGADPTQFYYRGRPYEVTREDGRFLLSVELPFTEKQDINLSRHADELVIDLGSWRRTLVLPRILVDVPTQGASFEDGTLKIRFDGTPLPAPQKEATA